ncbi:hypothetical protein J7443_03725 [Tropicibacter sp. R15_0]|uniref:hypothetical protein n=1 Tax=Tropicibacter sp. R15_0 TaxID=2821101 RepID=UPI001ADCAE50|nr:hypothetical protein [Tropicibacter sp. R15_0]MBO9464328.1 hypothetical protein [Tropicibacter sp. R15_0]
MSAKFITGVLTAAAFITTLAIAAPAEAGNKKNDNLKKFIAGAATLYLLHELHENGRIKVHGYNGHGHGHGGWKAKKPPIPRYCITKVGGKKKGKRIATRRCLKHNYSAFHRLPKACKTTYWRKGHKRPAYAVRCLKNHGFRISKRH